MNKSPSVWVLADDRAGNVNQALGVAESLGLSFEVKDIYYNDLAKWPNIIRGRSLMGIDLAKSSKLDSPWPDIIISAGRKTAPVARYIKKVSMGRTKLVQIMWPGFPWRDFDIIAVPKHDDIPAGGRIINTIGAPNRITPKVLEKKGKKWHEKFDYLPSPKVALLVGGDTKKGKFTEDHARDLANKIDLFFGDKKGSLLITNSRRTSEEATEVLKKNIKTKFYFHDFHSTAENPYFGYLALADAIIASGDSISMCSEACSTGKPVYIYSPDDITPQKHQKFHKNLYAKGYAKPLSGRWEDFSYEPMDDAKKIADVILEIRG